MERNALRSARWFGANDLAGFIHRASLHAEGFSRAALDGRPIIGICNAWSELVNCNLHFRGLAEAAKRGVLQAGGLPLEFPTISLGENLMKPSAMLFRNLMAMDVEECIRSYPLDAVVLLGGCDKTVPAQLMGAASAGVPAIMVTGGPSQAAYFRGRELGAGTDLWHYADELRAGRMSQEAFAELEAAATPSFGHCNELGTASTMTALVEALGMCLPGTSTIPAVDAARMRAAEATGSRAVALAREGLSPARIITAESLDNAITLLMALGGGTNAVVHLLALAGRLGVPLTLDRFDELSRRTPVIGNLRPSGEHLFEHLHRAGGVQAVLKELAPLLHGERGDRHRRDAGAGLRERGDARPRRDRHARRAARRPGRSGHPARQPRAARRGDQAERRLGRAVAPSRPGARVRGRLRRPGAHRRPRARRLGRHRARAAQLGPRGGPGMPEWGQVPIPKKLLAQGVSDMVRVSDARMSGTAFGTVVLHVAPESAAGGPLAAVRDGDPIVLDVEARRIDLDIPAGEIERRLSETPARGPAYERGYGALYLEHVLQADQGCDFDFLRAIPGKPAESEPLGLLSGWVGGW